MGRPRSFTEEQVRAAVAASQSYSEVLIRVGLRPAGGNHATIRRYVDEVWRIDTTHFYRHGGVRRPARPARPLAEILVAGARCSRHSLKRRLYDAGLKSPRCEMCGQGEVWRGARLALILDHVNGVWNDNRLENLRILCPNCNATLDTHCGRKNRMFEERPCRRCGTPFMPRTVKQRYCSRACGFRHDRRGQVRPSARRVQRPSLDQLRREVAELGYRGTGRRYGVSDNAVRKWLRAAEQPVSPSSSPSSP